MQFLIGLLTIPAIVGTVTLSIIAKYIVNEWLDERAMKKRLSHPDVPRIDAYRKKKS